ncbi:hypothetical protein EST38_g2678 [Candolleomyces aberdarensis]|uniref:Argonaute-like protein n=1 Tax=Candolleomyces aberdarensis TaxID=2316362 RepID=A0A4Q2DSF9_9AGAR|nr:hypothetical protein EST38_g2678 [Candolleomyces aberdarensis]
MPPKSAPRGRPQGGPRGGGPRGGAPRGASPRGTPGAGRGGTAVGPTLVSAAAHVQTIGVKRDGTVGYGQAGRVCRVQVNAFSATLPESKIHHYDVVITPDNLPARVNLLLIKTLQNSVSPQVFTPRGAYDGRKNIFCPSRLNLGDTDSKEFDVPLAQANGGPNPTRPPKVYKVKLTLVATINPELLDRFVNGQQSHDEEAITAITACNVALKMEPNLNFPFNTRSFFVEQLEKRDIGGGIELWRGLFQSLRPGIGRVFVNVDIATGIMYKRGSLIGLCLEALDRPGGDANLLAPANGLPDHARIKLQRFITGLSVTVDKTTGNKKRVIRSLSKQGADQITFDHNGTTMTVARYFQQKLGRPLQYPRVLCAEIGRNALVPLEVCNVPPGQIMRKQIPPNKTNDVLEFSKKRPDERFGIVQRGTQHLQYGQSQYVRSFGMSVDTTGFIETNGRVLDPPTMKYSGQNRGMAPGTCMLLPVPFIVPNLIAILYYRAQKKLFKPCSPIPQWVVIVYEREQRFGQNNCRTMIEGLTNEARNLGITFAHANPLIRYENGNGDIVQQLRTAGKMVFDKTRAGPTLFVVVLPDQGDEIYTAVKHFGDIIQGVATQCLKSFKCSRANAQYWANVLLKVNVKLGGINAIPDPSLSSSLSDPAKPTIIMGADVQHPAPGADGRPSFAALVSSVDLNCTKYIANTDVQEGRVEIIAGLKKMVKNSLQNYADYRKNVERAAKPKPVRLIFFRDGVSEPQFKHVLDGELPLIKEALAELDMGDCKVTLVVVGKRHHIRFNPVNPGDKDKSGNAPAGLVVDRDIGHPVEFDYYLQSQGGLLGTSRSSHYSVLFDENRFNADAMQAISFSLCHVYARATRSVSIPAPVYYADIVCARSKHHYDPATRHMMSDSATQASDSALQSFRANFRPLSTYAQRNMYFS